MELELDTGASPEVTNFEEGFEPDAAKTPEAEPNGNGADKIIPEPATAGGALLRSSSPVHIFTLSPPKTNEHVLSLRKPTSMPKKPLRNSH